MIPLPFTCLHSAYAAGFTDDHGNTIPGWLDPVPASCFWWSPMSSVVGDDEPVFSEQVAVDLTLVVDSSLTIDQRDRFTVNVHDFEVVGLPKDYDHGPFTYHPRRQVVELKWVG